LVWFGFVVLGVRTEGLTLAKQAYYHWATTAIIALFWIVNFIWNVLLVPSLNFNHLHFHNHSFFYYIHMCIQCLGHFSPLPPDPSLTPLTPRYQAETILLLPLVLLKREYRQ
jgi:hypothetical protein